MPSAVHPPSARERIGGRWAVSRATFVVFCALTIPVAILRPSDVVGDAALWSTTWVEIVVAQCLLIGVWLLIADRTILRRRRIRPVPIWVVFAVSGAVGPLRMVPAALLTPESLAVSSTDTTLTAFAAVVSIVALNSLTAPVVAYVLATRDWYVTERARLLTLEVEAEERRLRAVGALDAMRALAVRATDRDVRSVQADARDVLDATTDPVEVADALLAAARSGVRPLGHALASPPDLSRGVPHVSIAAVIAAFLRRRPLPIAVPLGIFAVVAVPRIFNRLPPVEATVTALLALVGTVAVFAAARPVVRRLPAFAIPIAVVACLLAVLPAAIARDAFSDSGVVRPLLTIGIALFTALFATGMVLAASDTATQLLQSLRAPVERAEVERLALDRARADLERELGRHLHASVQSGLVAASYAIQDAVARGDVEAQDAALRAARELLDERIEVAGDDRAGDDAVDLPAAVAGEWATIIAVRWDPDPPPAAAGTRDVLRLLRECLSNAVIHGHARHADVRISATPTSVLVEVRDDGVGPTGGDAGLGSAVLDDLTGGAWTLDAGEDGVGAVARAEMPRR